jgi:BirA family biotin operon repressor/biotin-[acetyl-CoA-carboxylase] ligase
VTAVSTPAPHVRRRERFGSVGSTNDVVRGWLGVGEPEVCIAVADEQTAGRGRNGRTWTAPAGSGLLLSVGFRPTWLAPDQVWRLAATVSLAMADAAETAAGLARGSVRLKWPNDLVIESGVEPAVRKLGGVLGETDGLGTDDPRAIIGIGLNADWSERAFPDELRATMTSLRAVAGDRPIDLVALLDGFLARLDERIEGLHAGQFDAEGWVDRQVTSGRPIQLVLPNGTTESVLATGVDPETGALQISTAGERQAVGRERSIFVGDVVHVQLEGL